MAKGAQDWVARTDILLQTLQELIIRNKYGIIAPAIYAGFVNPSGKTTMSIVSGKGNIYWGGATTTGIATQENDYFIFTIDGIPIVTPTYRQTVDYGPPLPGFPGSLIDCLDNVNFRYGVRLGANITFENTIKVEYVETYGRTPYVTGRLVYALV